MWRFSWFIDYLVDRNEKFLQNSPRFPEISRGSPRVLHSAKWHSTRKNRSRRRILYKEWFKMEKKKKNKVRGEKDGEATTTSTI